MTAARRPARADPVNSQFFFLCQVWHKKNYVQPKIMLGSLSLGCLESPVDQPESVG
jgi:hypothetical protein